MNIVREFGSEIDRVSFHWAIAIKLIPVGFCLFEDDKFIHPYLINHSVLGTRTLTDVDYVVYRIGDFSTIIAREFHITCRIDTIFTNPVAIRLII